MKPAPVLKIPGIYKISNELYHRLEGISKSGWYTFEQSPLGYFWEKTHPTPPSKAMDNGTVAHSCILEGLNIEDVAVIQPASISQRRTSKPGQDPTKWELFQAFHKGKIILKPSDWNNIQGMIDAVRKHPRHDELLAGGIAEQSFFWHNEEYGFVQKCRPDYLPGDGVVTSLKTTANARAWQFGKIAGDKRYHWSGVLEMEGVSRCTGSLHDQYYHFVVEQEPPHQCVIYEHYGSDIDAGQQQLEILYQQYTECLKRDEWPGYQDGMLHMPPYATYVDYDQIDDNFINPKQLYD